MILYVGDVIRCQNDKEKQAFLKECEKQGYTLYGHKPTDKKVNSYSINIEYTGWFVENNHILEATCIGGCGSNCRGRKITDYKKLVKRKQQNREFVFTVNNTEFTNVNELIEYIKNKYRHSEKLQRYYNTFINEKYRKISIADIGDYSISDVLKAVDYNKYEEQLDIYENQQLTLLTGNLDNIISVEIPPKSDKIQYLGAEITIKLI